MSITWDLLFHHGNLAAFRIEAQVLGPEVYLVVLLDDAPHRNWRFRDIRNFERESNACPVA